ncbi:hypothetical protein [Thalassiella azotivora]
MDLTVCPECGLPAEVEWRQTVPHRDDGSGLVKLRCLSRHWFLMPSGRLLRLPERPEAVRPAW